MTTQITAELFEQAKFVRPYPAKNVVPVPVQIQGTSFFPGGHGIWKADSDQPAFPVGGVMILGHDFHNVDGYLHSLADGQEDLSSPTWRNLLALLKASNIEPSDCFFTNFFLGLRSGKAVTGIFPGSSDPQFVSRCRLFMLHQLAVQKPKLVLVLGNHVPYLISSLADKLEEWSKFKTFDARDKANLSVLLDVRFHTLNTFRSNIVSLVHPSYHHANIKRRRYTCSNGEVLTGEAAEWEMIQSAMTN